jgi:hypothetical protein
MYNKHINNKQGIKMLEDERIQIFINGKDFDIIKRVNDAGTKHNCFDLVDYNSEQILTTCYDMEFLEVLLSNIPSASNV